MDRRLFLIASVAAGGIPLAALAAGAEKKEADGGNYVPIQTLMGTTLRGNGRRGVLSVDCGLEIPDAALRTRAEQSAPRLRAAYLQTVQAYAARLGPTALPNAEYIASALQRQTDAVLGRPGARLLLGGIVAN